MRARWIDVEPESDVYVSEVPIRPRSRRLPPPPNMQAVTHPDPYNSQFRSRQPPGAVTTKVFRSGHQINPHSRWHHRINNGAALEVSRMTKQRWTVRSMDSAMIERVRSLQAKSGAGLGEIVSLVICYGLDSVHFLLAQRQPRRLISQGRMLAGGRGFSACLTRALIPTTRP
jgi:hypothetical protein